MAAPSRSETWAAGWHALFVALALAAIVVSGMLMRVELLTPDLTLGGSFYGVALALHAVMAVLGVVVPLPALVLGPLWLRRAEPAGTPARAASLAAKVALVSHALALAVLALGLARVVPSPLFFASPLLLLAVTLGLIDLARRQPFARAARSPLALGVLGSMIAAWIFLAPIVFGALDGLAMPWPDRSSTAALVAALGESGPAWILLPTALGLGLELTLVGFGPRPRRRGGERVLGLVLAVVALAYPFLAERVEHGALYVADTYVEVGLRHGLLVLFATVALLALLSPRRPHPRRWLTVTAVLLALAAPIAAEVMLGMQGMPRRYYQYDDVFTGQHVVTGVAWAGFLLALTTVTATWVSARRRERGTADGTPDAISRTFD
ncbi:MAG: hypothetical protein U1F43_07420 [Myxococcota bacterium]